MGSCWAEMEKEFTVLIKKQIRFGYAYDLSVSDLSSYLGGSHEFIVAYHVDFGDKYKR